MTEMSETEKKRVAEQRKLLGEEGLNSKRQILEMATKENKLVYFNHQNINSLFSRHHYVNSSR